jgi:hypothetical protein
MPVSIEHQMTEIYCFIDDYLKAHPRQARWRRSPHAVARFTDAEVLTIALLQGAFQVASLKQTYRLVQANFHSAFPHLPSYAEWLRRLHQLTVHVGLNAGRSVEYVFEGDSVPDVFIPKLIALFRNGMFPFDRLIKFYELDNINQAVADSESGATLKAVIRMPH